mgnify:CR=1 FL=1
MAVTLADIRAASEALNGHIVRTPTVRATGLSAELGCDLRLKLETQQHTGSFKPRGAVNALKSLPDAAIRKGIITASGGNHGKAVAYAGWIAKTRAIVYLPSSAPPEKAATIKAFGAGWRFGQRWREATTEIARMSLESRAAIVFAAAPASAASISRNRSISARSVAMIPAIRPAPAPRLPLPGVSS